DDLRAHPPGRRAMNACRLLPFAALALLLALGCSSPEPADVPPAEEMVFIPAGEFWMGNDFFPDAKPDHRVRVDAFWIDATDVTNEQFAYFVKKTAYKTIAERRPDPKDFPDVPPEDLVPFSGVFTPPAWCPPEDCKDCQKWWTAVRGASWRRPEGPGSD